MKLIIEVDTLNKNDVDNLFVVLNALLQKNDSINPDWSTAPAWAKWWAVDADRKANWYDEKPSLDDFEWVTGFDSMIFTEDKSFSFVINNSLNWKTTLRKRPSDE